MNHQTSFDQFFIAMAFDGPIYYIATEDIILEVIPASILEEAGYKVLSKSKTK